MKLIKKISALFICVALCLSFPHTSQAAELKDASKGLDFSQGFPSEKTVYTAGNGTITYMPPSDETAGAHKLILDNASISTEEGSVTPAICFGKEQEAVDYSVEIEVLGENTITVNYSDSDDNFGRGHAIYLKTEDNKGHFLKLSGSGVLNLHALTGIGVERCGLEIKDTTINVDSANNFSRAINARLNPNVTIEDVTLNLNSSQGIFSDALLSIKNSNLTIHSNSEALYGEPLEVDASTVNAVITGEDVMGGFCSSGDCTIKGSKLTLDGSLCRYGLYSNAGITIDQSEIYLNCPFEGMGGGYLLPYVLSSEAAPVIKNESKVTLIHYPDREATKKQPDCDTTSNLIIKVAAADYTELEKALAEVPSELNSYTEASVHMLNDVLAQLDWNKNIAEQDDVDAMVQAVYEAIANLKKLADYSRVDAAIAKAQALNKDHYKDFSPVETAINAVVRDKDITEQDAVDSMANAIEDAIAALEKKPIPIKPDQPSNPEENPVNPPKENQNSDTETTDIPKTGDNSNPSLWFILMGIGFTGIVGTILFRRNKKINR